MITVYSEEFSSSPKKLAQATGRNRFVPPANFAPVERRLYRCAEPQPVNFSFLKQLKIRTVVWLAAEDPNDNLLAFCDDNDVRFEHLGLLTEAASPWDHLTDNTIRVALELILDVENAPVLVCCSMGRHRTGTVVGCLRKLQNWSFASLIDEYSRFTGLRGERSGVELCIENFDPTGVDIPRPPPWAQVLALEPTKDHSVVE